MACFRLPRLAELLMKNGFAAGSGYTGGVEAHLEEDPGPLCAPVPTYACNWWREDSPDPLILCAGTLMKCLHHHRMIVDLAIGLELSDNEDSTPANAMPGDPAPTSDCSDDDSGNLSKDPGVGLEFSDDEWPHLLEFSDDENIAATTELLNKELSVARNLQLQDPLAGMELSNDEDVAMGMELSDDEDIAAGMELSDSE
ncbi:hypothetical protein DXG01_008655 [Tephrocybe rancida]|nr:hypothetical protein DXG01_008655 [Tephrocybe rancida]